MNVFSGLQSIAYIILGKFFEDYHLPRELFFFLLGAE